MQLFAKITWALCVSDNFVFAGLLMTLKVRFQIKDEERSRRYIECPGQILPQSRRIPGGASHLDVTNAASLEVSNAFMSDLVSLIYW